MPSDRSPGGWTAFQIRRARTSDVRAIARLVAGYADDRILLHKETVTYYEDVQEFWVATDENDRVLGCGTLTVDSIGEQSAVLASVPRVQQVQTTLYQLIETDRELRPDEDEDDEEPEPPVVRPRGAGRRGCTRRCRDRW